MPGSARRVSLQDTARGPAREGEAGTTQAAEVSNPNDARNPVEYLGDNWPDIGIADVTQPP